MLELTSIVIMSIFYVSVGIKHFTNPSWFLKIVPPILPYKLALVYISGFFEIVLGLLLLFPSFRYSAIWANDHITAFIFFLLATLFFLKWNKKKNLGNLTTNVYLQLIFYVFCLPIYSEYIMASHNYRAKLELLAAL